MDNERIRTRSDLRRFLKLDLEAHGYKRWKWSLSLIRPQLHYQRNLRRTEYWAAQTGLTAKAMYAVTRILLARKSQRLGLSVPPGVFGPGLCLQHYGTVVVNDKARFGAWCTLHTSTNIGERAGKSPQGGDYIYIAPGAVMYGGITIGDNAVIGANSVVNSDVPSNVTVAGAPARIILNRGRVVTKRKLI